MDTIINSGNQQPPPSSQAPAMTLQAPQPPSLIHSTSLQSPPTVAGLKLASVKPQALAKPPPLSSILSPSQLNKSLNFPPSSVPVLNHQNSIQLPPSTSTTSSSSSSPSSFLQMPKNNLSASFDSKLINNDENKTIVKPNLLPSENKFLSNSLPNPQSQSHELLTTTKNIFNNFPQPAPIFQQQQSQPAPKQNFYQQQPTNAKFPINNEFNTPSAQQQQPFAPPSTNASSNFTSKPPQPQMVSQSLSSSSSSSSTSSNSFNSSFINPIQHQQQLPPIYQQQMNPMQHQPQMNRQMSMPQSFNNSMPPMPQSYNPSVPLMSQSYNPSMPTTNYQQNVPSPVTYYQPPLPSGPPQTQLLGPPPMQSMNRQPEVPKTKPLLSNTIQQFNQMNINPSTTAISNRQQPQAVDLLREKNLLKPYSTSDDPLEQDTVPRPHFPHDFYTQVNCHSNVIRCTLTSIPESQSLLSKCRLPLGILLHPFRDLESLKVVQSAIIVRCRNCRSYINPFVHFLENSKWRCNMCYSINDLPDEFLFDPVTRNYGDPLKRPEINTSTIEFIAPAEYTLRPPPPAAYLFLLDVSRNAIHTGYLLNLSETLLDNLDQIPGDTRTQIGFVTYDSALHFYQLKENGSMSMMIYADLDDEELELPLSGDQLLVNLHECKDAVKSFLKSLPSLFESQCETDSALGSALEAAFQLLKGTGGRVTVCQTTLPQKGHGSLKPRQDESIDKDSANLAPQTDFYKKFALECAGVHIAVDLFMLNAQSADLTTLGCVARYSGGEIKFYPDYHVQMRQEQVIRFCGDLKRYLTRKIGLEAVMRVRCTRGLAIHTFHGNFFVRSTDLLALPNVNPDAGFGMQVSIEDSLADVSTVCFQTAVLYTSSKGERRIRIHTYCLPVTQSMAEIVNGADQEAIIGLVAKMAVDRTTLNSLKEAKDALVNVCVDYLQAYGQLVVSGQKNNTATLMSPFSLRCLPLYVLALMKNISFRFGNIRMDERVYAMNQIKTMPLKFLMLTIYPHLYALHNLDENSKMLTLDASAEQEVCIPPRVRLSSENIDRHGVYLMDAGEAIYMWIGRSVSDQFLQQVFDCKTWKDLPDNSVNDLPELENDLSSRIRDFIYYLFDSRPFSPIFLYFREDSAKSQLFFDHMIEEKTESSVSYYEFLRHLSDQVNDN